MKKALRIKEEYLTADEWNERKELFDRLHIKYTLQVVTSKAMMICKSGDGSKTTKVITMFDGELRDPASPNIIMSTLAKYSKYDNLEGKYGYFKNPDTDKVTWAIRTATPFRYCNEHYAGKNLLCWSYDINSSYAFAMLSPMPDTTKEPRYNDRVRKGEMGFFIKSGNATDKAGVYADIIFPLMDSPFKEYVMNYYKKKKNATNDIEKHYFKDFLNIPSGCFQKKNIFIRNAILYYSNKYVRQYTDDNTVYCNTDSIVSLVPRPDLPVGDEIGQFKVEHNCEKFKFKQVGIYQWDNGEKVVCRHYGVTGANIKDIDDITDWKNNYKYKYDWEQKKVILNEKK